MGHEQDPQAPVSTARRSRQEEDREARAAEARRWAERHLDRRPFGEALARRLAERLWASAEGTGLIHQFHRDDCGHGLIRTAEGVKLCETEGGHFAGPAIAQWDDHEAFVAFFARQSDRTCSGSEPGEPVFYTEDDWSRCNQRLARAVIEAFRSGV